MAETIRDFIVLLAQLILILVIVSVVLSEGGIIESVFAFSTYAEPITLLNHLSSAITTVSYVPGEAISYVKTSGVPYIIDIYEQGDTSYLSIDFSLAELETNIRYEPIKPIPIISDCKITEQKLVLTEGIIQEITIKKIMDDGDCIIYIDTKKVPFDFNVTVFPESGFVLNGSSTTAVVTVSLVGTKISPGPIELSALGEPDGVTIGFSKSNLEPDFDSKMTISADPSTTAGTYYITIMGSSERLVRTAVYALEVSPIYYTFVLNTEADIINLPLTGVEVNVSNDIKYTRKHTETISNIVYGLISELYYVSVEDMFDSRLFSHFRDFDCDNTGEILDTDSNPYWFKIIDRNRDMTAYYRTLTQIRNLEFDNTTFNISGSLLDEDFNPIAQEKDKYQTCGAAPTPAVINRDVRLEYFDGTNWIPIGWARSSFTDKKRFYDDFDDNVYDGWTVTGGTWNVINGELSSSGAGMETIQTEWDYWNSSGGNSNLETGVRLFIGDDISIRIFDSFNEYYLQTNDSYNNLYLWINGANVESVALTGIDPNAWNTWRIKQNGTYMEFYINNEKLIRYDGVPAMSNGKPELRSFNTVTRFNNITMYDGSWSYHFNCIYGMEKIRAVYIPSDWYYNFTSAEIDIDPTTCPCGDCISGNDIICRSNYPDGSWDSACSSRHWSGNNVNGVCAAGEVCKETCCETVDADLTSYDLPGGETFARTDTITIPYTIINSGDITWTFLIESPIVRPGVGWAYPGKWDTLNPGSSLSSSYTYDIGCGDPIGMWSASIYVYTDSISQGGWNVHPAEMFEAFNVVECLDDNDCQTCLPSPTTCVSNICCVCSDWADGNCFQEASPACPAGTRKQTRTCTHAVCGETRCSPDNTCCGSGGEICVATGFACTSIFGGTTVALDGCTGATPVCCDV